MSIDSNRFVDNGVGIKWIKRELEETHEKPDTQGTIIEHTEES